MKKKYLIDNKIILISLALLCLYVPPDYAVPHGVYIIWQYASCIVAVISIFMILILKKTTKLFFFFMLYFFWWFIGSTFISSSAQFRMGSFVRCVGLIALLEVASNFLTKRKLIYSYVLPGLVVSLQYFISYIQYSNVDGGMLYGQKMEHWYGYYLTNQNWYFLTYDNESIFYFLPIIALLIIYAVYFSKKIVPILFLYYSFVLYMYIQKMAIAALAGLIIFTVCVVLLIVNYKKGKLITIKYKTCVILGVAFEILLILITNTPIVNKVSFAFNKASGFSYRDIIWSKSLNLISKRTIWGYGTEENSIRYAKHFASHCHNFILENLYVGGIIAVALLITLFVLAKPKNENSFDTNMINILILSLLMVAGFDWIYTNPFHWSILYFSYYISRSNELELQHRKLNNVMENKT